MTAILEMAFAGNVSIDIDIKPPNQNIKPIDILFAEECGILLEVSNPENVLHIFSEAGIKCQEIGKASAVFGPDAHVKIHVNGHLEINEKLVDLREEWELVGDRLGEFQTNPKSLKEAREVWDFKFNNGFKFKDV